MNHQAPRSTPPTPPALPDVFARWFEAKGWAPHAHQIDMLAAARAGRSALLIAPTGGGKTLAGFLPSLVELAETSTTKGSEHRLHTLYISPLKALAVDIHRNLTTPIEELALPITAETRTGDTPTSKRQRQRKKPPDILMTTPESLALLLSYDDAPQVFASLRCIVIDELHALAGTKRGELLALALARISTLAPEARRVGLSATVAHPLALEAYLSRTGRAPAEDVTLVRGGEAARAEVKILLPDGRLPWSGHMGLHAVERIYGAIKTARTTLIFVNTRAQAELIFQGLWKANEDHLPIALHHGSLAAEQRRKVENLMSQGGLRAVVATSSLDLGIDWAAVDLVVQVGAPKGASRLLQRIGRANHRLDAPSRALLVPANRFEVLECKAAMDAVGALELDGDAPRPGGLDVLAQHVMGTAVSGPFDPDTLYREVITAAPYADLDRQGFDDVVEFVRSGGYALQAYERFQRIRIDEDGRYTLADKRVAQSYRMNVGTIVEAITLKVRLNRGRVLGEIEEYFVQWLRPGDTFLFAGRLLTFQGLREQFVEVSQGGGNGNEPAVPAYVGGKLPLTTQLADRVRGMLQDPDLWPTLPGPVEEWLEMQRWRSVLPRADRLLVETFPRRNREYLVAYTFEGRNAHQTLGMLLTKRMERLGYGPMGFVATDYVIAVWSVKPVTDVDALFDQDMLGDDLEDWMAESSLLKRTFRNVAVIAGLIERKLPGHEKTGRQVTFNADLIYDVLRRHQPDHILLRATREDAARGLTDIRRLADLLVRVQGRIDHRVLDRVSPLAVPILLEIGKEQVTHGGAVETLMDDFADDLIEETVGGDMQGSLQI